MPGQRKDMWHVPALFGDTPMKKDCLPLGFQFQPCPDQERRCDLSGCSISSNSPWKIFEGCWHSFHLCCLTVVTVCPICSKGIEDAIKSLGAVANQTIHTRQNATATDGLANEGGEDTVESRTSDDDNDDEPLTSSIDGNVEQVVQNLTIQIMTLSVAAPPVQPLPSARGPVPSTIMPPTSSSQRRAPHCSTCGHLRLGHQRPVSQGSLGILQNLISKPQHSKLAAVLILPPDKTMLLLVGRDGECLLMESHIHCNTGGIIASAGPQKVHQMALYIEYMAKRDWTSDPTPFDMTVVELC
ncbi:uncharacterized protein [Montipora capricornis]|uniref:uncharacterized protein isoform X2 n=1 Tax=Montipora capricornis TaxID=246305 RepID=UPI0035F0FBEA